MLSWISRRRRPRNDLRPVASTSLDPLQPPDGLHRWAPLAQDRAGWHKLVTEPPFKLGKPFVRQPRGDTRVNSEDKQRLAKERAAEIADGGRISTQPSK